MPITNKLLRVLRPVVSEHVYTIRRGFGKGLKRRGGFEFVPEGLVKLTPEDQFLMKLDLRGKTVYDLGAFQGRLTICFARAVGVDGRVIAFEPNPRNHARVSENVQLNGFKNVQVLCIGVGSKKGAIRLQFDDRDTGRSSFREDYFEKRNLKANEELLVEVNSIDNLIADCALPKPDFVKMDVEEFEFEALTGMKETVKEYKPQLLIELHGASKRIDRVLTLVLSYGYSIWHIELGDSVTPATTEKVQGGQHIYCC